MMRMKERKKMKKRQNRLKKFLKKRERFLSQRRCSFMPGCKAWRGECQIATATPPYIIVLRLDFVT